jgi:hypothetical protein
MRNAKMKTMKKLKALSKALAKCGIEHDLYDDKDSGIVGLRVHLWNCVDGSDVLVEAYGVEEDDYEFDIYAQPEEQLSRAFEKATV